MEMAHRGLITRYQSQTNLIVVSEKMNLRRLVNEFNTTYQRKRCGRNDIPSINLPSTFEFGDSFLTHDLRLSRDFSWHERWRMTLIGEGFQLFNIGISQAEWRPAQSRVRNRQPPSDSGFWFGRALGIPAAGPPQFLIWLARAPGRSAD